MESLVSRKSDQTLKVSKSGSGMLSTTTEASRKFPPIAEIILLSYQWKKSWVNVPKRAWKNTLHLHRLWSSYDIETERQFSSSARFCAELGHWHGIRSWVPFAARSRLKIYPDFRVWFHAKSLKSPDFERGNGTKWEWKCQVHEASERWTATSAQQDLCLSEAEFSIFWSLILWFVLFVVLVWSNGAQSHENWMPWAARGRCMKKLAQILIDNFVTCRYPADVYKWNL